MMGGKEYRLFFYHFFEQLEERLGVNHDIDKYEEFINLLEPYYELLSTSDRISEEEVGIIYRWAEYLFLPVHLPKQKEVFQEIFINAVNIEKMLIAEQQSVFVDRTEVRLTPKSKWQLAHYIWRLYSFVRSVYEYLSQLLRSLFTLSSNKQLGADETLVVENQEAKRYINIKVDEEINRGLNNYFSRDQSASYSFMISGDYSPIPKRKMVQIWRSLRMAGDRGNSKRINIPETVKNIAKAGLFLQPTYESGVSIGDRGLLIFADQRGSMVPFHDLTTSIIQAAVEGGGHKEAEVFYFENYPLEVVYSASNGMATINLKAAFKAVSDHRSVALIISDAGAARGKINPYRIEKTLEFIKLIRTKVAHVAWVNPMPFDRWVGSSAEIIAKYVDMFPVLDAEEKGFSNAVKLLLGKNVKGYSLM